MPLLEETKYFDIQVSGLTDQAYVGENILLTIQLSRPHGNQQDCRLNQLESKDPNVILDIDMFQHGLIIRPGEFFRFQIPVKVLRFQDLDLAKIEIVFEVIQGPPSCNQVIGKDKIPVKPSLRHELEVKLDSLCRYEEGTKVLLTLRNKGARQLKDFTLGLGPPEAVAAGKTHISRPLLNPGEEEKIELIVGQSSLDFILGADVEGQHRSEWGGALPVVPISLFTPKRFRFLEPRRLNKDSVTVVEMPSKDSARQDHSAFILHGDSQYLLRIEPAHSPKDVTLRDIYLSVQVRKKEKINNGWNFTLDVISHSLFRKPDRLFYEMETSEGKLTGDVPICVARTPWQYGGLALQLGALSLLGGVVGVGTWLKNHGLSWDEFEVIDGLRVLAIPAILLGYWFFDWLQYQFRK